MRMSTTSSPPNGPVLPWIVFSPASWKLARKTNSWWRLCQPVNARATSRMSVSV